MKSTDHPIDNESLAALTRRAIDALCAVLPGVKAWCEKVRPAGGELGRFRWALQTTRGANVAGTAYVLGGLRKMGILDDVFTDADRRAAVEWVRSMCVGNEQYRDPALMNRKTPGWPDDEPWPSPAMLNGINQYARNVLSVSLPQSKEELPALEPPPGWPQADDDPAKTVEWIKARPWKDNPWGAGSHANRVATWLLRWCKEGKAPLDAVIEALQFFYDIQDPRTGLWGGEQAPLYARINGTFKLFSLLREQLDFPLPHAGKVIDQVLAEFYRPDYDCTVGACDEWDNWYVIALAECHADGHRAEEVRKMAAYRIARTLELFSKPDGGLSYGPETCVTNWIGFDMAPAVPQGDAMGPGILAGGINVCIDLLDIQQETPWTGKWRLRPDKREPDALREEILSRLSIPGS